MNASRIARHHLRVPTPGEFVLLAGGTPTTSTRTRALQLADMDSDGRLDVVAVGEVGTVSIHRGRGDGTFETRRIFGVGSGTESLAVGDVDGDGRLDVVTASRVEGTVSLLLGDGKGGLGSRSDFAVVRSPSAVAIRDVNGDGRPDLVVGSSAIGSLSVLIQR